VQGVRALATQVSGEIRIRKRADSNPPGPHKHSDQSTRLASTRNRPAKHPTLARTASIVRLRACVLTDSWHHLGEHACKLNLWFERSHCGESGSAPGVRDARRAAAAAGPSLFVTHNRVPSVTASGNRRFMPSDASTRCGSGNRVGHPARTSPDPDTPARVF
jgi:hypothetical protein